MKVRFLSLVFVLSVFLPMWGETGWGCILPYDYSDPDVTRLGKDYYMTYSTFACVPGLQILHSTDGFHWSLIDAALPDSVPGYGSMDACPAGCGVWAPSLRFHAGRFYIYYGDPDRGIYCIRSEVTDKIPCRWEPAVLVKPGKGLIDPCPLWEADGRCWLVHAFAGSRAGFKSALAVCELTSDGLQLLHDDVLVFDGHPDNPTCEGPKFHKREGYYYIFCPAGGVKTGWQLCLRSRSPYGPYECKRVLEQGTTEVNAPHQGAWVDNFFWHFQDVGMAGRIVHVQPLKWHKGWPVIGNDGEPLITARPEGTTTVTEEFDSRTLPPEWQWSGNRKVQYCFHHADSSFLRLFTYPADNVQTASNLLLRKIPYDATFTFEARLRFTPYARNVSHEQAGLIVHGRKSHTLPVAGDGQWWYARIVMDRSGLCRFYLSRDGHNWSLSGDSFQAVAGEWIGAKIGFYATRDRAPINDSGYLDVDRVTMTISFGK